MPTTITTTYAAGSTIIVSVTLTDEDGTAAIPSAASWSLYRDGEVVNEREDETIGAGDLASTMEIVLSGADLVAGLLYFVFDYTYTSTTGSDLPGRDWARITIEDVAGI